jgi:malate dehydrogenase
MSVSTFLQGEYGFSDVSIGVPVILGRNGVERILKLKLSKETRLLFKRSVLTVTEAIKKLNK